MNAKEMKELLLQNEFCIFGTGYTARMLVRALEKQELHGLRAFCRSEVQPGEMYHGLPVISVQEAVKSGRLILLGVHDGNLPDIPYADTMIRVYPYLKDWLFGEPLMRQTVKTAEIRQKQPHDQYWIAVRYAGIAGIAEQNDSLRDLYVRAMSMHASKETAHRRLEKLQEMFKDMEQNGLDPAYPVALDENLRVIDGLHRLAAAAWLDIPEIQAEIYPISDIYEELFTEKNRLPEAFLRRNGFLVTEIAYLKECKKRCG